MTLISDTVPAAMTHVVIDLERALDLLLSIPEHTLSIALLAEDVHEIVVTIHETGTEMVSVQALPSLPDVPSYVARAVATLDAIPAEERPLWALIVRSELAAIARELAS